MESFSFSEIDRKLANLIRVGTVKEADYKKAIELKDDYFDANYNLGAMIYNQGADMNNAANDIKDNKKYNDAKAKADERLKQALPYLEKANEINPKDKNTLISLKQVYARIGDQVKYQKAKEELNISIIDFFYSMRIRTNYRDMSFLDELDAERTRRYFLKNHEASTNFFQLPQRVQKRLSCQHPLGEKEARYNATFLAASSASPAAASPLHAHGHAPCRSKECPSAP